MATPTNNSAEANARARGANGTGAGDHSRRIQTAARTNGSRNKMFATIIATTPIRSPSRKNAWIAGRPVRRLSTHQTTNQYAATR